MSAMSLCESDSTTPGASNGSPPNQVTESSLLLDASSMRSASETTSSWTSGDISPRP
ncbi:MAG: hypothetical protein IKF14_11630 [Atopobiaceae bacterium]|nr:hypothetical protein [Atopobiaceae bacterium]